MPKTVLSALALAAALLASPSFAQTPPAAATAPVAQAGWWEALGDPQLASLVAQGLEANHDVAQAQARILRSRALLEGARAERWPSGSVGLQGRAVQLSETEAPGVARTGRRTDSVAAVMEFSWEADLFGRLGKQAQAAGQRVQSSEALLRATRVAVSAEIAHAWFAWLGAREQLGLARTVAANREGTLRLVAARAGGGLAAPVDEVRARADLEAALAEIPALEAEAAVALHRLAVLTGRPPAGFTLPDVAAGAPMSIALPAPAGPDWLARRPDIQALESELQARSLDVAAVRAEFYPRLTLTGVLGFVAGSAAALGSGGSVSWLAAPSLFVPLFDRPRIEARLAAATADQQEALARYHQQLLVAAEEVENALARYGAGQRQFQNLQQRARLAAEAERLARVRYQAGAADLLELLEAQRTAQQAEAGLSVALTRQRQNLVAVFRGMAAGA